MSKMGSHCSFGHLKHKLWPKGGPGVELPGFRQFWLPTTKSRESTRNTWLQKTCDIALERSRRDLQLCFRRRVDRRSAPNVMKLQSRGSPENARFRDSHARVPKMHDFGTPTWESRESRDKMAIWMPPPRQVTEYTIRWKVVASPKVRAVVSLVCPCCPWFVSTPKGSRMSSNHFMWFHAGPYERISLSILPSLFRDF